MAETPRGIMQDGTDMPHSVAATPPNERVPEVEQGPERFLTEVAKHSKTDGSEWSQLVGRRSRSRVLQREERKVGIWRATR
jgi:hypothetical protein